MRLNEINDNPGARKWRVRIGRGIGSGCGKTGGRGGKGQTARSGVAIGGFEGGQMPLHRRLPKRGFNKWRAKDFNEINVGALQKAVEDGKLKAGQSVDLAVLIAAGVLRREKDGLRVLGTGELKTKLSVTANGASATAKSAIETCRRFIVDYCGQGARSRRIQAQEDGCQKGGLGQVRGEVGGLVSAGLRLPSHILSTPECNVPVRPGWGCAGVTAMALVQRRPAGEGQERARWYPLPSSVPRT